MKAGDAPGEDVYIDGIAFAPLEIREKCSTVLHIAGCTDWDASIDYLISTNLKPTIGLLKGSIRVIPNLENFIFCSTAFAEALNQVKVNRAVPEAALSPVSDSNHYFADYAKVKAMTEHAIQDWVHTSQFNNDLEPNNLPRILIVRPGSVAPSVGIDGVPFGWHTDNKSFAAGVRLMDPSNDFGQLTGTFYAKEGQCSGVIPVDHVANMIVLAGGNPYFLSNFLRKVKSFISICVPHQRLN